MTDPYMEFILIQLAGQVRNAYNHTKLGVI